MMFCHDTGVDNNKQQIAIYTIINLMQGSIGIDPRDLVVLSWSGFCHTKNHTIRYLLTSLPIPQWRILSLDF